MDTRQMNKFTDHCNRYFYQTDPMVLHSTSQDPIHIDVLRYAPNQKYPFWKLVTMGASDYKMPNPTTKQMDDRNEYMFAVEPEVDLNDLAVCSWYYHTLLEIATAPMTDHYFMTYGHSVEWPEQEDSDMVGAYISMPQILEDVAFLHCRLGLTKRVTCLQAIPLTRQEMDHLMEIGPEAFDEFLYPYEGDDHYLCQQYRSDKF